MLRLPLFGSEALSQERLNSSLVLCGSGQVDGKNGIGGSVADHGGASFHVYLRKYGRGCVA